MKYLVTGVNGQLGYDVVRELNSRGITDILEASRDILDITNKEQINKVVSSYKPDVIVHCAAYTAVDKAENDKDNCFNINVNGSKYLAEAAKEVNAKIIYLSTDYVFNGTKNGIYETDDAIDPINYYGLTKYLGEEEIRKNPKHFIVRISWVFGINGKNFIKTMLTLAETKTELGIVSDQIGSPTYTRDLAKLLVNMSLTEKYGTYHATNEEYCSWNEFAKYIFEINNIDMKVNPVLTQDYRSDAQRPLNSKLSKKSLDDNGFDRLPTWKDAANRYNEELKEKKKMLVKEKLL